MVGRLGNGERYVGDLTPWPPLHRNAAERGNGKAVFMDVTGFNINITSEQSDAMVAWYRDVLRLPPAPEMGEGAVPRSLADVQSRAG